MITKDLNKIITELINNNIVSIPTDTIYSLSCKISKIAVTKITKLKKRNLNKGFIIISHKHEHLIQYINKNKLSNNQIDKICSKQPEPITWIAPSKKYIDWLTGNKKTIAIRLVTTKIVSYICKYINNAIISTSVNISKENFLNNIKLINKIFNNVYILKYPVKYSQPSKIIDIISGKQYR